MDYFENGKRMEKASGKEKNKEGQPIDLIIFLVMLA